MESERKNELLAYLQSCIAQLEADTEGVALYLDDIKTIEDREFLTPHILKEGYTILQVEDTDVLALAKNDDKAEYILEYMKYNMCDLPYAYVIDEIKSLGGYFKWMYEDCDGINDFLNDAPRNK